MHLLHWPIVLMYSPQGVLHSIICNRMLLRIRNAYDSNHSQNIAFSLPTITFATPRVHGGNSENIAQATWSAEHNDVMSLIICGRILLSECGQVFFSTACNWQQRLPTRTHFLLLWAIYFAYLQENVLTIMSSSRNSPFHRLQSNPPQDARGLRIDLLAERRLVLADDEFCCITADIAAVGATQEPSIRLQKKRDHQ